MTHREQLLENYEDALFAMWMDDLATSRGEELLAENERLQADPESAVPAAVRQKNLNLIQRELLKNNRSLSLRSTGRSLLRLVLVAAVLLALFSAAYALSPEFRSGTLNLLMQIDEKAASFQLVPDESSDAPAPLPTVSVGWLPEGYEITPPDTNRSKTTINCFNSSNNLIKVTVFWNNSSSYDVDFEDTEICESLTIQGHPAIFTIKFDSLSLAWADEHIGAYVYVESNSVDRDCLVHIAESIVIEY